MFVYHVTATRSLRVDYGVLIPATTSAAVLSRESNARRRQLPETFGRLPERERHQHVHKPDGVHHSVFERVNTRDVKTTQSNVTADTLDWLPGDVPSYRPTLLTYAIIGWFFVNFFDSTYRLTLFRDNRRRANGPYYFISNVRTWSNLFPTQIPSVSISVYREGKYVVFPTRNIIVRVLPAELKFRLLQVEIYAISNFPRYCRDFSLFLPVVFNKTSRRTVLRKLRFSTNDDSIISEITRGSKIRIHVVKSNNISSTYGLFRRITQKTAGRPRFVFYIFI